jgi:uncharacterized repeat protein (TIGR03803 family)
MSCDNLYGCGTIFKLSSGGNNNWTKTTLHSFAGTDGRAPWAGVTLDGAGNLYGSTQGGGAYGHGVVFQLTP